MLYLKQGRGCEACYGSFIHRVKNEHRGQQKIETT